MKQAFFSFVAVLLLSFAIPAQAATNNERMWQDEAIYFIMVDRFNNMDPTNDQDVNVNDPKAYHGGDLKGVTAKLDYIKEMGFTAIWLTPIFQNEPGGYHGYWISDFYKVDPHFGTLDDLKTLVKEAHKRDIKVILDFVVNHTGPHHPWLNDPTKKDWFHEKKEIFNWTNQQEVENGWLLGLPDLAQENPEVKRYLIDAANGGLKKQASTAIALTQLSMCQNRFGKNFRKKSNRSKKTFSCLAKCGMTIRATLPITENTESTDLLIFHFIKKRRKFSARLISRSIRFIACGKETNHFTSVRICSGRF